MKKIGRINLIYTIGRIRRKDRRKKIIRDGMNRWIEERRICRSFGYDLGTNILQKGHFVSL